MPSLTVTESNPAHRFEYMHFTSDEVVTFAKEQADIIRKYAKKDAFITTNFMGG